MTYIPEKYQCKVCGRHYELEDDPDNDISRCGECNREIDMKVEEKLLEGKGVKI